MTVNTPGNGCPLPVTIRTASTDLERAAAQELLAGVIPEIAPNAVPTVAIDRIYRPVVALAHDASGRLVGGALTCRPQRATGISLLPPTRAYRGSTGRSIESANRILWASIRLPQGAGVGSDLVRHLEGHLSRLGVRHWFGNVIADLEVARLRSFYTRLGFTCLGTGTPLPPFGGQDRIGSPAAPPAFCFWKNI